MRDCEHGHLARSCGRCEDDETIARLTRERDHALDALDLAARQRDEVMRERDEAREAVRRMDTAAYAAAEIHRLAREAAEEERDEARAEAERWREWAAKLIDHPEYRADDGNAVLRAGVRDMVVTMRHEVSKQGAWRDDDGRE